MEFRLSIIKDGQDLCRWRSSQDEHERDEVIRHIFLIPCSMPIPCTSHLPSWTIYLDDIRLRFSLRYQYIYYIFLIWDQESFLEGLPKFWYKNFWHNWDSKETTHKNSKAGDDDDLIWLVWKNEIVWWQRQNECVRLEL